MIQNANVPPALTELATYLPKLAEMDQTKLEQYRQTAIRFAPTVMKDPLVLGCWIQSTCQMGYVDSDSVKRLMDAEKLHRELTSIDPYSSS